MKKASGFRLDSKIKVYFHIEPNQQVAAENRKEVRDQVNKIIDSIQHKWSRKPWEWRVAKSEVIAQSYLKQILEVYPELEGKLEIGEIAFL